MLSQSDIIQVDHRDYTEGGKSTKLAHVDACRKAWTTDGFLRLHNHGIPVQLMKDTRTEGRKYFKLPKTLRRPYIIPNAKGQVGEIEHGTETGVGANKPDHKVLWSHQETGTPIVKELPNFNKYNRQLFKEFTKLDIVRAEVLAVSLGLDPNYFVGKLGNHLMRHAHYPAQKNPPQTKQDIMRGGNITGFCAWPHTDISRETYLLTNEPGLQLIKPEGVIEIDGREGELICNLGDMTEHLTGGECVSGQHQVICIPDIDRDSTPMFCHFEDDVNIEPLNGNVEEYPYKTAGEYLGVRLGEIKLAPL